jgi:hypothetical protein
VTTTQLGGTRRARTWRGWLNWLLLVGGVAVSAIGGMVIASAWTARDWHHAWIAGLLLLLATLMAIEGMRKQQLDRFIPYLAPKMPAMPTIPDSALPRLGEILVYKYGLIAERDLKKALAKQAETGKRLGEVLVEMGKLDWHDLAMALEDQLSYGDPWKMG